MLGISFGERHEIDFNTGMDSAKNNELKSPRHAIYLLLYSVSFTVFSTFFHSIGTLSFNSQVTYNSLTKNGRTSTSDDMSKDRASEDCQQLLESKQTGTAREYISVFRALASGLGWNEAVPKDIFYQGLRDKVKISFISGNDQTLWKNIKQRAC
jgi:hypothetical protein